jgi:hypothetical protein
MTWLVELPAMSELGQKRHANSEADVALAKSGHACPSASGIPENDSFVRSTRISVPAQKLGTSIPVSAPAAGTVCRQIRAR